MTTSYITLSTCGISRDCGVASKDKSPKGIEQNSKDFEAFPKDKSFFGNETFLGGSSTDVQANTEVITILFWNGWFKSKDYGFGLGLSSFREKCGTNRCRTVTDRNEYFEADVVVVFAAKLKYSQKSVLPPKSSPEQIYVFLNTEPPTKYHTKLSRIRPQFNITISYRADSTIQWPYGKVIPRVGDYQPMNEAEMTTRNRTAAWLVSGCTDVNIRMTYFKEMTKYIQVDVYGKCGELKCPETNSQTTEFMGGANYTKYLPPKSYIDVKDFQSPKHLAEYIIHLDNNPDEYMKYFDWKRYYTVVNDIPNSDKVFCELCELLRKKRSFLLDYKVADWWENDTCVNDVTMLHNIYHVN
ncbi:hypothetical protein LSH36_39g00087 [Paralvinella palmiformis]|uniref:Fucosyltransferase n=1 Tax=Paralvinella palmiformis TaxID=53620 RepID=A0AAD9K7D0_9ANNE|nr:hypothetical protein LSH36_39g00087 [Paralvinella palmiformis]